MTEAEQQIIDPRTLNLAQVWQQWLVPLAGLDKLLGKERPLRAEVVLLWPEVLLVARSPVLIGWQDVSGTCSQAGVLGTEERFGP